MLAQSQLDRVLVIAPHPDDDVLSAAGLIQRTLAAGGQLRILLLTAGERNEWPQRAMLKKWRINNADRAEWARLRMNESAEGLARLGAPAGCSDFLGYADQKLAALARSDGNRVISEIAARVRQFDPTLVVVPSAFDVHSDHRATALLTHHAAGDPSRIATYVVHGAAPASRAIFTLQLSDDERRRKQEAIEAHQTQLLLAPRRFLSYARATETFFRSEEDLVRVQSAPGEMFDTMRHAAQAVGRTIVARLR